jgi:hypothetical protein
MSAYLVIALGVLAWLGVGLFVAVGFCQWAKRGDAELEQRIRDLSR